MSRGGRSAVFLVVVSMAQAVVAHDAARGRVARLEARIASRPADARLWLERGELWRELGEPTRALADFDRARALDPELAEVDLGAARAELDRGRPPDAVAAATRFLLARPASGPGRIVRARALVAAGSPSLAITDFDHVLSACRSEPPDPQLVLDRARAVIAARGRDGAAEAIAGIEHAVARVGPLVSWVVELVELEVESGRYDAAARRCDAFAAGLPRRAEWWARAARSLELAGRFDEARARYALALQELVAAPRGRQAPLLARLEGELRESLLRLGSGGLAAAPEKSP